MFNVNNYKTEIRAINALLNPLYDATESTLKRSLMNCMAAQLKPFALSASTDSHAGSAAMWVCIRMGELACTGESETQRNGKPS
jgi:hypothetical protein